MLQALTKEKYYEILNAIFRNSGAGVDLNLQLQPGEDNSLMPAEQQDAVKSGQQNNQEMGAMMQELSQVVQQNAEEIEALKGGQPEEALAPPVAP